MNLAQIEYLKQLFQNGEKIQWKDSDGKFNDVLGFCLCNDWLKLDDLEMDSQFILNCGFSTSEVVDFYDASIDDFYIISREKV